METENMSYFKLQKCIITKLTVPILKELVMCMKIILSTIGGGIKMFKTQHPTFKNLLVQLSRR